MIPSAYEPHNNDYERLKTLYLISKKLSTFKSVDESFPEIVNCAAESFPLMSAVLIEHWEEIPKAAVWFSAEASKSTIANALLSAKTNYSYLSGASELQTADLLKELSVEIELLLTDKSRTSGEDKKNYIFLPLMIDNLPPLGALQLEGAIPLNEKDLEFVDALASLVSVALDRFYKTKAERASREKEISDTKIKVDDLEMERRLRENFVSLLTHDLKSPLTAIKVAAQLICKRSNSPDICLKFGNMIFRQSDRVVKMINTLLDANQIKSGQKLDLKLETVNLNSLVAETVAELKMIHGDRFVVETDHLIENSCDAFGIKRVIENLCNNAIKYGSSDTPVKILLEETDSDILIRVQNRGQIISEEEQKRIFQQFHRTENASRKSNEGWGIGLTLVRGTAEAHGGSVEVESTAESGTIFTVKLSKDVLNTSSS